MTGWSMMDQDALRARLAALDAERGELLRQLDMVQIQVRDARMAEWDAAAERHGFHICLNIKDLDHLTDFRERPVRRYRRVGASRVEVRLSRIGTEVGSEGAYLLSATVSEAVDTQFGSAAYAQVRVSPADSAATAWATLMTNLLEDARRAKMSATTRATMLAAFRVELRAVIRRANPPTSE